MYREGRDYYDISGVSAEEVIDGLNMLHREGAATKYLFRCNNVMPKGNIAEDLRKCRHYLERCLQYPAPIRNNTASYWISKINPEVFDIDIYSALFEIITAVGELGANYQGSINNAIDYVNNAIKKY